MIKSKRTVFYGRGGRAAVITTTIFRFSATCLSYETSIGFGSCGFCGRGKSRSRFTILNVTAVTDIFCLAFFGGHQSDVREPVPHRTCKSVTTKSYKHRLDVQKHRWWPVTIIDKYINCARSQRITNNYRARRYAAECSRQPAD